MASTAAFQPGPLMAVYYATKAYVLSFSEALATSCSGTGVTVTALCPGPTATGFSRRASMEDTRLVRSPLTMDAASVARVGYRALMAGQTVAIQADPLLPAASSTVTPCAANSRTTTCSG